MKFNNGCWLFKEGCQCFAPKEVYFADVTDKAVTVTAPTAKIVTRGDTLGGINLTVEITAPYKDVFRIRTYHHLSTVDDKGFVLEPFKSQSLKTKETENDITVHNGSMKAVITKDPFTISFFRNDRLITKSSEKDLALMKTAWQGLAYDNGDEQDTYIRQMLSIGVGELIYGMGERFTPFVKNGQTVDIWNADGGTSTEQSYKNIPFFISNKGYGVFVNHPENVSFEVATEMVTKTQFSVKGGYLDYFIMSGDTMKDVLERYTDITGKPSLPAPWTFGLWLSTSFTTSYDEATVMSFIDGMLDRGIPLRTFHFDCFWMKEFHWTDFVWDKDVFPDPKGLISRIKKKGLNVCVWINSYIAEKSALFKEGMEKGYFIKRKNGKTWQWDMWQPGLAIVDFTNPDAYKWYQDKLAMMLDYGVDCFKTDFGERIPTEDVVFYDGTDPEKMHNYYTYLYNKCVYELLEKKRGKGEAVLFARSATAGGQKFPVHWGGDCWSDYESMEESLRGGLSLLMSGFGYWAHDIGGFENTSTADVYKRWVAFGLLSSHSRLHGSSSYRVPWVYDEEAVDVVRFFTKLKARLMPYLYANAIHTSKTGIPMMRSMVLEFTEDKNCHYLDKQYMMGDSLLVAPVFNDESIAEYYLPEGNWTNFFTGKKRKGGKWYTEKVGYLDIPLWVRENSAIVLGSRDDRPDYDYSKDNEIRVYELSDKAAAEIFNDKNKKIYDFIAEKTGSGI
ncbi:MAG: alpha-xylosidase, partial [Lachnospiraceae bacterium]|nr:alpha-xylosidase [Lachnospiraceae bacterium]